MERSDGGGGAQDVWAVGRRHVMVLIKNHAFPFVTLNNDLLIVMLAESNDRSRSRHVIYVDIHFRDAAAVTVDGHRSLANCSL